MALTIDILIAPSAPLSASSHASLDEVEDNNRDDTVNNQRDSSSQLFKAETPGVSLTTDF